MSLPFSEWQDETQASSEPLPPFRAASVQAQRRPFPEKEFNCKPSAKVMQPISCLLVTGPTHLLQDCPHKPIKSLPTSQHQPKPASPHHACPGPTHYTSLNSLQHTCQNSFQLSDSEHHNNPHFDYHVHHHSQPISGHHTCPGFLHYRDLPSSAKPEASIKFSSRSRSYEKSSVLSMSASSSKAATPLPSPQPSHHPSPCPSPCPSLITPAAPSFSADQRCSPALTQKVIVTEMNRLSADARPQQRGKWCVCNTFLLYLSTQMFLKLVSFTHSDTLLFKSFCLCPSTFNQHSLMDPLGVTWS